MSAFRLAIRWLPAAIILLALYPVDGVAQWKADASDARQVAAEEAILRMRDRIPRSHRFFDDAYGYAVFPSVGRFGFGFGGAYGRGVVVAGDQLVGHTSFWQFTSGIQAGAKYFSMIVFFKDREALEYYQQERLQFLGQAGVTLATVGANGTPAYNDGVAIITVTRLGLMGEFTISGGKFRYFPLDEE
jgi:lipid-binding SYLF domain-containing protein